jgi:nucleotidyltransferase substrate binding protein (TIGR01987 family)
MKEIEYAVLKLENAFDRLREGLGSARDDLDRDGAIQRFEFTFELLWKTAKVFLEWKGIPVKSPKDALKEIFRYGLIYNETAYLNMLEERNRTSHIYHQATALEIFQRIQTQYSAEIENFIGQIKINLAASGSN